jgi:hypothetical protein
MGTHLSSLREDHSPRFRLVVWVTLPSRPDRRLPQWGNSHPKVGPPAPAFLGILGKRSHRLVPVWFDNVTDHCLFSEHVRLLDRLIHRLHRLLNRPIRRLHHVLEVVLLLVLLLVLLDSRPLVRCPILVSPSSREQPPLRMWSRLEWLVEMSPRHLLLRRRPQYRVDACIRRRWPVLTEAASHPSRTEDPGHQVWVRRFKTRECLFRELLSLWDQLQATRRKEDILSKTRNSSRSHSSNSMELMR